MSPVIDVKSANCAAIALSKFAQFRFKCFDTLECLLPMLAMKIGTSSKVGIAAIKNKLTHTTKYSQLAKFC